MKKHLVPNAQFWYNAAKKAATEGKSDIAYFNLREAYNHVENALAHILEKVPGAREEFERVNGNKEYWK